MEQSTASTESVIELNGDWHRTQGIAAFNATWELLGAETRSAAQNEG